MPRLIKLVKHRITILLAIVVALLVALQLAAPTLLRLYGVSWLRHHGAVHAEIRRVRINPWLGRLSLWGLKAGELSIDRAHLDIDWWPLWHHRIDLRQLHIDHARLSLVRHEDGSWAPAGLRLAPPAPSSGPAWQLTLHSVRLDHVRIDLAGNTLHAQIPMTHLALTLASRSPTMQVLNADLSLGQGRVRVGDYHVADAAIAVHGQLMLATGDAPPQARQMSIRARGLSLETGKATLAIDRLLADGITAQGPQHIGATDVDIQGLKAADTDRLSLGAVHSAALTGLSLQAGPKLAFSSLDLQGVALPATPAHALGRIDRITATGATIDGGLRLHSLALKGLDVSLLHQKQGLAVIDRLRALAGPTKTAVNPAAKTSAKAAAPAVPALRIGSIDIDKGSRVHLRDTAVDPPFDTDLQIASFRLSDFDTRAQAPSRLDAALHLGDEGRLTVKGSFRLHGGLRTADMHLDLRRLSMPPLSGYMERDFGNAIDTGQMDLDSRVHLAGGTISAKNRLTVRNLALKTTPQTGQATQALGMPLDVAVSMLRDDRGDIALDVPVSGRLDDPNVHLSNAFDQALASAMRSAALSSASLLLQPYGSILPALSMAAGVIGEVSKPRLTPIDFAPHSTDLSKQAQAYLERIAVLLHKKKDFRLQVCGVAARGDVPAGTTPHKGSMDYNRLLTLAAARSSQIVKALVAAGVNADRLFSCRPHVDTNATGGRVELIIN